MLSPDMKAMLNDKIKRRESFRPFAPFGAGGNLLLSGSRRTNRRRSEPKSEPPKCVQGDELRAHEQAAGIDTGIILPRSAV
jgi:hypothetical protein